MSGLAGSVGGCFSNPNLSGAAGSLKHAVFGQPDVEVTRAAAVKLPYASLLAKIGRGPRSLLVLGRYDGPDLHWISADRAAIVTRRGRLVATAGFPADIRATRFAGTDPVAAGLHRLQGRVQATRRLDMEPGHLFDVGITSTLSPVGPETIEILELQVDTVHVREDNRADALDWRFTNDYWADATTGFVWKSVQHFAREYPPIEIAVVKPAA